MKYELGFKPEKIVILFCRTKVVMPLVTCLTGCVEIECFEIPDLTLDLGEGEGFDISKFHDFKFLLVCVGTLYIGIIWYF